MKNLKQLLANKNVVTILGAIMIVLVLYGFYQWRVKKSTTLIDVPYANVDITSRTQITEDMISWTQVNQSALKGNVLINTSHDIVGHYVNVGSMIPAGSFFFANVVIEKKELPDSFLIDIKDGMVAYNFRVDVETTYGNSMYPGNYVDVYFKGVEGGKVMLGKLLENVEILAVKDSSGNPVFETSTEERTPSQIIFSVTDEMHKLLRKAEYIQDAELILVPTNVSYEANDGETIDTIITSDYIKNYIEQRSIDVN